MVYKTHISGAMGLAFIFIIFVFIFIFFYFIPSLKRKDERKSALIGECYTYCIIEGKFGLRYGGPTRVSLHENSLFFSGLNPFSFKNKDIKSASVRGDWMWIETHEVKVRFLIWGRSSMKVSEEIKGLASSTRR
ncbi:hypothetical protein [Silvimonas soli]|uniref:hypothetical protein n=1 Tax=Silvimonas soli TaxID=2980100 RepID=UPI0024B33200|nr:hypothetical protein [Silvimonas soli]